MTLETLRVPTGATGAGGRDGANLCLALNQGSSALMFHILGFCMLDFI